MAFSCRGLAFALVLLCSFSGSCWGVEFGHKLLDHFTFPEGWVNLNQGSWGACPAEVQRAREGYQRLMDSNPEAFFRANMTGDGHTGYADLIDRARASLAAYLRADVKDLVLVDNASSGLNAVLRSLAKFLGAGKGILFLDTAYVEVQAILRYLAGETPGALPSPSLQTPLVQVNITHLMPNITRQAVIDQVESALRRHAPSVGLCTFSHIISTPGLVLPVEELTAACHRAGAKVLIDGAHAPGNIPLDLTAAAAEFYVGNGHKWLFSPKGSAFLHVKRPAQRLVFPVVIDSGPGETPFTRSFMWQGTHDPSPMIALHDALLWRERLGDADVMKYMAATAEEGGRRLAELWGTSQMPPDPEERRHMQASMTNVRVPCGGAGEPECPSDLPAEVVRSAQTWVPVGEFAGPGRGLWARVSASVYTEVSDFEMYGRAVLRALRNVAAAGAGAASSPPSLAVAV